MCRFVGNFFLFTSFTAVLHLVYTPAASGRHSYNCGVLPSHGIICRPIFVHVWPILKISIFSDTIDQKFLHK